MKQKTFEAMTDGFSCASSLFIAFLPFYVSHKDDQTTSRSYFGFVLSDSSPFSSLSSVFLLALLLWGVLKILFAFARNEEKAEKASFVLYLLWPVLYLSFTVVAYLYQSSILFFVLVPFAALALALFYWDYHLFGQN
jgi:hypothetical protein